MPKKKPAAMKCPHCFKPISPTQIAAHIASLGAGNPNFKRVLSACRYCGEPFGAREMRLHIPKCAKNPNRRAR